MSTPTHGNIKATAAENARLLKIISETDYAPSALQQSNGYIENLKKEIAAQEKLYKDTKATVTREHKEHRDYADSHVKRLAYKLGGKREKFEERASKEQKDWVDAVQREIECRRKLDTLNHNIAEATTNSAELEKVAATYTQAQKELDQLYLSIFDGPTPDIPGEDLRESSTKQAAEYFNEVIAQLNREKQVAGILEEAHKFITNALIDVEDARSTAKADAFGFGGSFMEMHEFNAISRVQQHMGQAEMLLSNARSIQPLVGDIGRTVHAQNNFVTDVLFDNVFSDMNKYDKIKESKASIEKAQFNLKAIITASNERLQSARSEARRAKEDVDAKRSELQEFRANAYREIAGGNAGQQEVGSIPQGPPPQYQE